MKKAIITLMLLVGLLEPAGAQTRLDIVRQMLEQAPVQKNKNRTEAKNYGDQKPLTFASDYRIVPFYLN